MAKMSARGLGMEQGYGQFEGLTEVTIVFEFEWGDPPDVIISNKGNDDGINAIWIDAITKTGCRVNTSVENSFMNFYWRAVGIPT